LPGQSGAAIQHHLYEHHLGQHSGYQSWPGYVAPLCECLCGERRAADS
jgi:hypothetical protein